MSKKSLKTAAKKLEDKSKKSEHTNETDKCRCINLANKTSRDGHLNRERHKSWHEMETCKYKYRGLESCSL